MTTPGRSLATRIVPPVVVFFLVLGVWQATTYLRGIPRYLLPGPIDVFAAATNNWEKLAQATCVTAAGAVCGFAASVFWGTLIAIVFSQSVLIRRSLFPYAIFLQTVPIVAIAPLIILWWG